MIQKTLKLFLLPLCFFLLFLPVYATEETKSLEEFAEVEKLWELLPEEIEKEETNSYFSNRDKNFSSLFFTVLKEAFSFGITDGAKTFFSLLSFVLISALYKGVKDSFQLKILDGAFDFLFLLVLGLVTFSSLNDCILLTKNALYAIETFFLGSLPITTVLLTLSGSPGASATLAASLSMVLTIFSTLCTRFLAPLLQGLFAINFTESISGHGLDSITSFLQKTIKTLCILFFTLSIAALTINNALACASDGVAIRSVRFAAGNFIPIVGSLVGESAKTLSAAFTLIRTRCGVLCLLALFYIILRPIVCIVIQKTILSLISAVSQILSQPFIAKFFSSLSHLMDLLLAIMISEGCYLIFYITLFLTNKGGIA